MVMQSRPSLLTVIFEANNLVPSCLCHEVLLPRAHVLAQKGTKFTIFIIEIVLCHAQGVPFDAPNQMIV